MTVADADLISFGEAAKAIMTPYPGSPLVSSITEVYIDSVTGVARVQWSKGLTISATGTCRDRGDAPHNPGDVVVLPSTLVVAKGTYVIWSEVSYKYTPAIGYVLSKTGMTLQRCLLSRVRAGSLRYLSDGWQFSTVATPCDGRRSRTNFRNSCTVRRALFLERGDAVLPGLHGQASAGRARSAALTAAPTQHCVVRMRPDAPFANRQAPCPTPSRASD